MTPTQVAERMRALISAQQEVLALYLAHHPEVPHRVAEPPAYTIEDVARWLEPQGLTIVSASDAERAAMCREKCK